MYAKGIHNLKTETDFDFSNSFWKFLGDNINGANISRLFGTLHFCGYPLEIAIKKGQVFAQVNLFQH
jgi:hypothetical protein